MFNLHDRVPCRPPLGRCLRLASRLLAPQQFHQIEHRAEWRKTRPICGAEAAALEPERVVTGHGPAMEGAEMLAALHQLADQFETVALPDHPIT